ncbi:MAG: hypothetical protein WAM79_02425 [Candidatus Sulfotelmatobacter sp.]
MNDELQIYATGAGILEYAGELISIIETELKRALEAAPRTHGTICGVLNKSFHILKSQHFQWDIIPSVSVHSVGSMVPGEQLLSLWQQYTVNMHMLLATFDNTGQAYLYLIGQFLDSNGALNPKGVHLCEFPGYSTIGTGGDNANFWLNGSSGILVA